MHTRTIRLLGQETMDRLHTKRILVAGLGGVGASCALTLARCGIGAITLVDRDTVSISNLNRQAIAFRSTLGMQKVEVACSMIADIDPSMHTTPYPCTITAENASALIAGHDLVIDAIDDISAKVALAVAAANADIHIVSCMGTGNRLDTTRFRIVDLFSTHTDPLARVMRREIKAAGLTRLCVAWSDEPPISVPPDELGGHTPASIAFVPPAAGLLLASYGIEFLRGA